MQILVAIGVALVFVAFVAGVYYLNKWHRAQPERTEQEKEDDWYDSTMVSTIYSAIASECEPFMGSHRA